MGVSSYLVYPDKFNIIFSVSVSGGWIWKCEKWITSTILKAWHVLSFYRIVGSVLLIFLVCVFFCFVCLRPVSCVPNVASFSGLSTLYCLFGFLLRLVIAYMSNNIMIIIQAHFEQKGLLSPQHAYHNVCCSEFKQNITYNEISSLYFI